MALTILFLTLMFCCSCCVAQFTATQDPAMSGSVGDNIRMSCSRSGGSVTGGNYPAWYLQTPGSPPKLVMGSYGTGNQNNRPSGISDRFTGSLSEGSSVLSISKLQTEDEGLYICALYAGNGVIIFGGGTYLSVPTGEVKVPIVLMYAPSKEQLDKNLATVVCNAFDFTPRTASIEWQVDGKSWTAGVSTTTISKQSNNLYMASSFLSMSSSDYNTHESYSCKVRHESKDYVKILKRSECQ